MVVEIKSIEVGTEEIIVTACPIEQLFAADDLYEMDLEAEEVEYVFPKDSKGARTYLFKVCKGIRGCAGEASLGAMLDKLPGNIVFLSEYWRAQD